MDNVCKFTELRKGQTTMESRKGGSDNMKMFYTGGLGAKGRRMMSPHSLCSTAQYTSTNMSSGVPLLQWTPQADIPCCLLGSSHNWIGFSIVWLCPSDFFKGLLEMGGGVKLGGWFLFLLKSSIDLPCLWSCRAWISGPLLFSMVQDALAVRVSQTVFVDLSIWVSFK